MREYKYEDFEIGQSVYHKSNTRIKMIIVGKQPETLEFKCRWVDRNGNRLEEYFLFAELVKSDDYDWDHRIRINVI